jgi:activator of HSP90 ATPase
MSETIVQSVYFAASPAQLYSIYLTEKKHAAAINGPASIKPKAGGTFSAFNMLSGKFLELQKNKLIVQTWRSKSWKKRERDSTLILRFEKYRKGARIELVHAHVPEYDFLDIQLGWEKYYWVPLRKYLKKPK